MSHAVKTLTEAVQLINLWKKNPQFDTIVDDYRHKSLYKRKEQVIFLAKGYFRYSAQNKSLLKIVQQGSIKNRLSSIIDLSIIRLIYHHSMPVEIIVDSAVELVKTKYNKYDAGFTNQLLRKLLFLRQDGVPNRTIHLLPENLKKYWQTIYDKKQLQDLINAISQIPKTYISSLKIIDDEALSKPIKLDWVREHYFQEIINFSQWKNSSFFNQTYIQDPATFLSIHLLSPQKGEDIADLCASPGGKARLISQKIGEEGKLFCAEISERRSKRLKENLKDFNNVEIIVADSCQLTGYKFDAILLDVPCSNSGVFRRKPDAMWSFSSIKIDEIEEIQKKLLHHCATLIKKGGRIVYSTCSIDERENQLQIKNFLANFPTFSLEKEILLMPNNIHDGAYSALLTL